jgi:metallo-beta-lactamase class B
MSNRLFAGRPAALAVSVAGAILALALSLRAEGEPPDVARHVAAAQAAAGKQWEGLFNVLCAPPPAATPPAAAGPTPAAAAPAAGPAPTAATPPPASPAPSAPPERATWYAPPIKVFDNLYYVGMTEYSAWAVTTSEGIILIDTLYDYSVQAEVVDGLRQLGLDPATIKYAIVSHGHGDHSGGAKLLQDTFGTKIVLSAADWELLDRSQGTRPRRDVVATDGMSLTVGDTTLRLYVTPGHTLGTISSVIPLKDHGHPHVAVAWGGTAFNWLKNRDGYITPERPDAFWFRHYITSSDRFAGIAAKAHADVLLSNHTIFDGSKTKLPLLGTRTADQPNPYVVGPAGVRAYLTVAGECARAGLARLPSR